MGDTVIETNGLTVFYGKHRGIVDVNLTVNKGEVFGFLGPNGAGKTTTLRVLLDVIRPNLGKARIFDLNCQTHGVQIRERVGYVPGELALPPQMTGRQYLNLMGTVRGGNQDKEYRRQLSARFDLDITRTVSNYSRGNKQKLALVAAFMNRPDLLILDEPTGGLDPLVQQSVMDTVREARDDGRTVFFSSHILPEVQAVCDRVGIIRNGELVAVENVQDLLRQRFHRLRVTLAEIPPAGSFVREGVEVIHAAGNNYRFEITQNLAEFMQFIAPYGIVDLHTEELSLEEVFLTYYGDPVVSDQ